MAVIFELVAGFGDDQEAAARAAATVPGSLRVGTRTIALHRPLLSGGELSVIPVGVSHGMPMDRDLPRTELDDLTALAHGLYDVLRTMRGYEAAMVGWDPEGFVDLAELRSDWSEELAAGDLPGLVLSEAVRRTLAPNTTFEPFAPGFEWLPYVQ
jgi:hypothetical protein